MKNAVIVIGGLAIVGAFGWYMYLQSSKTYVDEKGQKYERTLKRGLPKNLATEGAQPAAGTPKAKESKSAQKPATGDTPAAGDKPAAQAAPKPADGKKDTPAEAKPEEAKPATPQLGCRAGGGICVWTCLNNRLIYGFAGITSCARMRTLSAALRLFLAI